MVYRGTDLATGRQVAVKTVLAGTGGGLDAVLREVRALGAQTHPHLVECRDAVLDEGRPYLVLEHLEGGCLAEKIDRLGLPAGRVAEIGLAVARALGALHARGILHLDVKPANVGFTAAGIPKLMDLGVSRGVGEILRLPGSRRPQNGEMTSTLPPTLPCGIRGRRRSRHEGDRILYGTLQYLPPEAFEGQPPSASWDLWGLAATLWEALTGERPFAGSRRQIVDRITLRGAPDPRTVRRGCPAPLARLLVEALRPELDLRPRSAREMAGRLEDLGRRDSRDSQ
jgi:serine/threonine protein kinase